MGIPGEFFPRGMYHVICAGVLGGILAWVLWIRRKNLQRHEECAARNGTFKCRLAHLPRELQWRILADVASLADRHSTHPHHGLWRILTVSRETYRKAVPHAYRMLYLHTPASFNRLRYTLVLLSPHLAQHVHHITVRMCESAPPLAFEHVFTCVPHLVSIDLDATSASAMCATHLGRLCTSARPAQAFIDLRDGDLSPMLVETISKFAMWSRVRVLHVRGNPIFAHALMSGPWPSLRSIAWETSPKHINTTTSVAFAQAVRACSKRSISMVWQAT